MDTGAHGCVLHGTSICFPWDGTCVEGSQQPPNGADLAEQTDEWVETKRYIGLEVLARCRLTPVPNTSIEEVTETLALTA